MLEQDGAMMQDVFGDDEPVHEHEPEPWRSPVRCPQCSREDTRFVTLQHEMSVYECTICGTQFEIEEGV